MTIQFHYFGISIYHFSSGLQADYCRFRVENPAFPCYICSSETPEENSGNLKWIRYGVIVDRNQTEEYVLRDGGIFIRPLKNLAMMID